MNEMAVVLKAIVYTIRIHSHGAADWSVDWMIRNHTFRIKDDRGEM